MNRLLQWFKAWKLVSLRSAVVAAFLIYTVVGFLVVPAVAKKLIVDIVLEKTGREVTVEEVRCNPLALTFTVRGFSLPDRPGSTMISFEELYANAQLSSLFRWAATLKELRVTSPFVALRRFEDGEINFLKLLDDIEERAPEKEEVSEGLPRVILQWILVENFTAEYQDQALEKPVLRNIGPGKLELHDISTITGQVGTDEIVIDLYRGGILRVTGEVVVEPFSINGTAKVENIFLPNAWAAISEKFEFDVVSGTASATLDYTARLGEDGPDVVVDGFNSSVKDLAVRLRGTEINLLEVPSIDVSDASFRWPEARVAVAALKLEGAEAHAWLEPDGTPVWAPLVPKETREKVKQVAKDVAAAAAWVVSVDQFEMASCSAHFEDRTFDPPVEMWVEEADFTLTDVITMPEKQWGLSGSVQLFGETPTDAEGFFQMKPLHLEAEVNVNGLDMTRAQPYIGQAVPVRLLSGKLSTSGKATLAPDGDGPMAMLTGNLMIEEFGLEETAAGTRITAWDRMEMKSIKAAFDPISLSVQAIDIHGARIDAVVLEDGRINVMAMVEAMGGEDSGEDSSSRSAGQADEPAEIPPVEITAINLHDCAAAYTDRSLAPPFSLVLQSMNGQIENISTADGTLTGIGIEGSVRSGGAVAVEGEMDLLNPARSTDLSIDILRTNLPPMSPMSVLYIGHPIDEGRADLKLDYQVVNSNLTGNNLLTTSNLTLGDEVPDQGAVDLPFKLGVSLLTDNNGLITFEVPVNGSLDDPGFGIGSAVGQATKAVFRSIVQSPFRLLGKLGGGSDEEDLGYVEFEAGRNRLDTAAVDRLKTLAAGLNERSSLVLLVEGVWDAESDPAVLREAKYRALLADREESLELLAALYLADHTEDELAVVRAPHLSAGEESLEGPALPVIDEAAYQHDLQAALLAAQPVSRGDLQALGAARAKAVRSYLTETAGIDPARVEVTAPVEAAGSGERMRCRLDLRGGS